MLRYRQSPCKNGGTRRHGFPYPAMVLERHRRPRLDMVGWRRLADTRPSSYRDGLTNFVVKTRRTPVFLLQWFRSSSSVTLPSTGTPAKYWRTRKSKFNWAQFIPPFKWIWSMDGYQTSNHSASLTGPPKRAQQVTIWNHQSNPDSLLRVPPKHLPLTTATISLPHWMRNNPQVSEPPMFIPFVSRSPTLQFQHWGVTQNKTAPTSHWKRNREFHNRPLLLPAIRNY